MSIIQIPQLPDGSPSVTVLEWRLKESKPVQVGEVLALLETETGVVELESPVEGTLHKILCKKGRTAPAGAPVAVVLLPGEDPGSQVERAKEALASNLSTLADGARKTLGAFLDRGRKAAEQAVHSIEEVAETTRKAVRTAREQSTKVEKPAEKDQMPQPTGPVAPILMPQAGNSMEEGTLLEWKVKVGDKISKGDILAEIETDKATMEVESEEEGTVALLVAKEGEIVPVKEPIAILAESEADAKAWLARHGGGSDAAPKSAAPAAPPKAPAPMAAPPRPAPPRPARPVQTPSVTSGGRVKASPAARRISGELGVPLEAVGAGRGPQGRILSTDVEAAAKSGISRASTATPVPAVASAGPVYIDNSEPVRSPVSKMRRAIGKNLVASKQNVPHFYVKMKFDASPLLAYQKTEKTKYKVSINDVLVLAIGRVLHEFPAFRTRLEGNEQVEVPHSNIGIAVGTDNGLIVPVVMAVEGRTLEDLAVETRRIVEAGRAGKVEGQGHGVFTISNLGMFGVPEFSAIINPPESGIMAVGTIVEEVIVQNGAMRPGRTMTLTLSADHRVVDGMVAGQFMARLKEVLEHPHVLD